MTIYVIGGRMEDREHALYDDQTGHLERREGSPSIDDLRGGFTELSPDDLWGIFRRHDDTKVFFRNDHMYPDDPERFLVFVDHLGPTQARVHYALDGKVVEQTVYKRVTELGVTAFDQYEEDWDSMLMFSKEHAPRRAQWPDLFLSKRGKP